MIEQVIKRDGKTTEFFQTSKIRNAIKNAYESVGKEFNEEVFQCVLSKMEEYEDGVHVEQIQDDIESCLFQYDKEVYDSFHDYRLTHKMQRDEKNTLVKNYAKKMMGQNVENQNANVDERSHSGRKAEASDIYEKEFALNNLVSKQTKRNHINNEGYIHDLSSYASGEHNCLSVPMDDLLANGATIGQTDVRPAGGVGTAMQLVAVYFQIQSQEQFGGVSATHLDWTMVPYVRKSFLKHYIKSYLKDTPEYLTLDIVKMRMSNYYDDAGVERNGWEDWVEAHKLEFFEKTGLKEDDFRYDNKKNLDPKHFQSALDDTLTELQQAVEGMYHNLNTLQSRSGGQLEYRWLAA